MIVVGEGLLALLHQHSITNFPGSFDETSLTLRLGPSVKLITPQPHNKSLVYGEDVPANWISEVSIPAEGFLLEPHTCLLACSEEVVSMPSGYLGMLQTKGSLARMFCTVHCCDSQVEPGYKGRITFEIVNLGPVHLRLRAGQEVAQLFVFRTSSRKVKPYNGRYQGAEGPTSFVKQPR